MVFFILPFESKIGFEFAVDLKRKPNQGFISKYFMSLGLVMVMIMEIMMIMVIMVIMMITMMERIKMTTMIFEWRIERASPLRS